MCGSIRSLWGSDWELKEKEVSSPAASTVPKQNAVAGRGADVKRHRCDEGTRHAGLKELSTNLEAFFSSTRGEFHFVVRNAGSANIFLEKPFHGTAAFEIHLRES